MSNILGFNFGHDGSIAILKNGKLVCAVSNERLSRKKKQKGVSPEMLAYVLDQAELKLEQIDLVAFSSYFYTPEESHIRLFSADGKQVTKNLIHILGGGTFQEYVMTIGDRPIRALLIQHHIAHAASTFYTSPFEQAACFSLDASGVHPEYCSLFAYGDKNLLHYYYCPGLMLGNAYSVFTAKLGVGPGLTKAGSTMALAALGERLPIVEQWREFGASWYERKFQPSDAVYVNYLWSKFSGLPPQDVFTQEESDKKPVTDIAASLQFVFEEVLVDYASRLFEETKQFNAENLCLSGGSFLNSDANMQIKLRTPFKRIHLFPACGDDGTAAGAALYVYHHLLDQARIAYEPREYMYLGRDYETPTGGSLWSPADVSEAIEAGKVVAWFQGKSEFGPRALGNRSLLADPRSPTMKDRINHQIKHREWYRPFAPSVLSERASDWFSIDFESKLMLFIAQAKRPSQIPAVIHLDNSARIQTVEAADNPRYHELISAFDERTGVPMVLNTSLNDNDEPLVETPEDALRFFSKSEADLLVIHDQVFRK